MDSEILLPYHRALKIYLEIYNYPLVIEKYKGYGLNETQAQELASKVSNNIADYENSSMYYREEIYGGLSFIIVGSIAAFLILTKIENYSEKGLTNLIERTIFMLPLGLITFLKGIKDYNIVKDYKRNLNTPIFQN